MRFIAFDTFIYSSSQPFPVKRVLNPFANGAELDQQTHPRGLIKAIMSLTGALVIVDGCDEKPRPCLDCTLSRANLSAFRKRLRYHFGVTWLILNFNAPSKILADDILLF